MAPMERLCDAHLHFFTREVLRFYARQSAEYGALKDPTTRVAERLGISPPPREPEDLAAQWAEELERHHVSRAFLFGSGPGEQRSVSRAVEAFPQRFVGFQMLNPRDPEAARATADIAAKGLRGLLLFPAMHLFFPDDPACLDTCRLARKYGLIVFVHIGPLRIVIQEKLGGGGCEPAEIWRRPAFGQRSARLSGGPLYRSPLRVRPLGRGAGIGPGVPQPLP